jgi:fructose-1-phosphate kinase PfkB-like protein
MGFAGGHTGRLLSDLAQNAGLNFSWTWIKSETRTCVILVSQDGDATEIDEPGMPVSKSDWKRLQRDVRKYISSAGLVCVSGSLPPHSSAEDLQGFLSVLVSSGKQVWVDTSGAALDAVLTYPGICVKVNGHEIGKSLGFEVKDLTSAKHALRMLAKRGLTASVITLGAAGALLATNEGRWHAQGPSARSQYDWQRRFFSGWIGQHIGCWQRLAQSFTQCCRSGDSKRALCRWGTIYA